MRDKSSPVSAHAAASNSLQHSDVTITAEQSPKQQVVLTIKSMKNQEQHIFTIFHCTEDSRRNLAIFSRFVFKRSTGAAIQSLVPRKQWPSLKFFIMADGQRHSDRCQVEDLTTTQPAKSRDLGYSNKVNVWLGLCHI